MKNVINNIIFNGRISASIKLNIAKYEPDSRKNVYCVENTIFLILERVSMDHSCPNLVHKVK